MISEELKAALLTDKAAETAQAIVRAKIYLGIKSGLYEKCIAVSKSAQEIAVKIQKYDRKSRYTPTMWITEECVKWAAGELVPPETWVTAILKGYSTVSVIQLLTVDTSIKELKKACLEWLGRREWSYRTLREPTACYFHPHNAPKSVISIAKALHNERVLDLQAITESDLVELAEWAYCLGAGTERAVVMYGE